MGPFRVRRIGSVLLLVGVVCGAPMPVAAQVPADSTLQRIVRERVESGRSAAIVLGVVSGESAPTVVSWVDPESNQPLDATTQFEIGSITKVFTGLLLAAMSRAGEVSLEDDLARHLAQVRVPERDGQQIRLIDLATHHSGLPNMPANFHPADPTNPYADYTLEQMYDALSETTLSRDVGAGYEYSNFGTSLLGQALGERAERPYEQLLRERILDPLGMRDTGVSLTPSMRSRLIPGHDASGNVVPNWDLGAFAPAGGLRSSMQDMLIFLAANLNPPVSELGSAITDSHASRTAISPEASVSLNWHTYVEDGDTVVYHPGETGGYRAFIGFAPGRKVGVVILSNSRTSIDDIGFHLLLPNSPLEEAPPWITRYQEITLASDELRRYIGEYEYEDGSRVIFRVEGDKLFGVWEWSKLQLHPEQGGTFFLYENDVQIIFEVSPDGSVPAALIRRRGEEERVRRAGQ